MQVQPGHYPQAQPPSRGLVGPNHDGSPQDGTKAPIGDPGPAIGHLLSVSSTCPMQAAMNPPAPLPAPRPGLALPILLLVVGLVLGVLVGSAVHQAFRQELEDNLDLDRTGRQLLLVGLSSLPLGIVGFVVGRVLSRRRTARKKGSPDVLGECSYVGTEGLARGKKTTLGDELEVMRFEEMASVVVERTLTSRVKGAQTTSQHESVTARFEGHAPGRRFVIWSNMMRDVTSDYIRQVQEKDRVNAAFADAAERAFNAFMLPRMTAALQQQAPIRFGVGRNDGIEIQQGRISVMKGGQQATFAPADVRKLAVAQGELTLETAATGPIVFPMNELQNAKLLLACLAAMGVSR